MLNTMNLIWAFDFGPAIDPDTKKPLPVNIHDYAKVRLILSEFAAVR